MRHDAGWNRYWRYLTTRFRGDVDDEIAFHIAMRARDLEAQGLSAEVADAEARRRFGDRERIRKTLQGIEAKRGRRMRWSFIFQELAQDARYGARALFRRPAFTLMSAGSLALGIAAVTVVLSVIDAYLLRPLPVRHPEEILVIGASNKATQGIAAGVVGYPTVRDIAARTDLFQGVAAHALLIGATRRGEDAEAERAIFLAVTGNYFQVLGLQASLGRMLTPNDDELRERVAVLSYDGWQTRFGGDSAVIGSTILVNTVRFLVVGVAPPDFHGTAFIIDPLGYVPAGVLAAVDVGANAIETRRQSGRFLVIARRKAERSLEDVRSGLGVLARDIEKGFPEVGEGYQLPAFLETRARPTLPAAGGMVAVAAVFATLALLVLVTASVNATNLILVRGSARLSELAVRQALGASRGRIVRQLLVEVMLLALIAFFGALVLAKLGIAALTALPLNFDGLRLALGIQLDARVFSMTLAFALFVGIVAGIGPSLSTSNLALQQRLREGGRTGMPRKGRRLRGALVVAQIAASMVVLVAAGLFISSAKAAQRVDVGFRTDHLLTFGLDASLAHYREGDARRVLDQIQGDIKQLPGVRSAVWASTIPISYGTAGLSDVKAEGASSLGLFTADVGSDYFSVMEIPVLEGRGINATDDSTRSGVVVLNQRAAELLWPGKSAIGRTLRLDGSNAPLEVVGVVRNGKYLFIGESPRPYLYRALAQHYVAPVFLHVRTTSDPLGSVAAIRATLARIDRNLTPFELRTMERSLDESPNGTLLLRVGAGFASAIGGMAVLLSLVGLYGVIVFSVTQRQREIGLRMALGATRRVVVRSILGEGARLAFGGIVIGTAVAVLVSRFMGSLIIGSGESQVGIFVAVATSVGIAALVSAYLPARRASLIDPVKAIADG